MADDTGADTDTSGTDTHDGGESGADEPKFTQADLDRVAARTRAEAKKAAAKELQDELGISPSQAKAIIEAKAKADADAKSEAERAADEAKAAKAEADRERAEAKRERFEAKLERRLGKAGVPEDALKRALRVVELDADADDDAIDAEIDTLRKEIPGLFETPDTDGKADSGKPKSPSGVTGGKRPTGGQPTKGALVKGAELYAAKHRKSETSAA